MMKVNKEEIKDELNKVLKFMENKTGTVDYPKTMTLSDTFDVYSMVRDIYREL